MTPEAVIDVLMRAIWTTVEISAPMLVIGLVVGLVMGLIQAATQIDSVSHAGY
jgi:flagellar biosynthesis protein FliQ